MPPPWARRTSRKLPLISVGDAIEIVSLFPAGSNGNALAYCIPNEESILVDFGIDPKKREGHQRKRPHSTSRMLLSNNVNQGIPRRQEAACFAANFQVRKLPYTPLSSFLTCMG